MKLDSVVQQRILVRPGARRPPSEGHLVPIPSEFFGYAAQYFLSRRLRTAGSAVMPCDEAGTVLLASFPY
jgi:hypothetical protein